MDAKSYGSIPHLPNSRLGSGDHYCPEGQADIVLKKKRDKNDLVIVTEKLDGSNVGVLKKDGIIIPLVRSGHVANTSKYKQHQLFHDWVMKNHGKFDGVLREGERLCGEWLLQAHGTRYNLPHEPFVAFDIMEGKERISFIELFNRLNGKFTMPSLVHIGEAISVDDALKKLGKFGRHGAIDEVEGLVYRVERNGKFDFICKFVKHTKEDGKYLESVTGKEPIWNDYER